MPALLQHLIIHERIGQWARQLRPRLADRALRMVETRSGADLEDALRGPGVAHPVVVLDLGKRARAGLEDLDRARGLAPDCLILVLDPMEQPGLANLARELGATLVLQGPAPPPLVADLLARWISLAHRRAERSGWLGTVPMSREPEPWDWLTPLLGSSP